ncbi:MAG: pilus assembly protein [Acidimicrobiales bacterium]|nr:pilus assembly protein [Acidimicrobiales bacterium]
MSDGVEERAHRGAAAVEMALVGLLLFSLVFGVIELGLAFRTRHTVTAATAAGVRAASVGSTDALSDYRTLQAIADAIDVTDVDLVRIVVFRADSPTSGPSASCAAGTPSSGSQPCNVYRPADFALADDVFGCGATSPDRFWCPTDRSAETGSLDLVGVEVIARHHYVTGVIGDTFTFTSTSILPVEPGS